MSERARFRRSRGDRIVAGVAGGLARDMGAGAGVVRLAFVLLAFAYLIGPILYVAFWIAMPAEPEPVEVESPTGRALRRTEGGIKLLRSGLGVVAGLVGLLQVAIPLAGDVVSLRGLVARADSTLAPPGAPTDVPAANALLPDVARGGDGGKPGEAVAPRQVVGPAGGAVGPLTALNVPAPVPVDPTTRDAPALRDLVDLAGRAEMHALATLDETVLHGIFVGDALQAELDAVRQLRAAGAVRLHRLVDRRIVRVASDGSTGLVEMIERWEAELRSAITGECVAFPDHAVPQTVHLVRTGDGWRVARIEFHDAAQPAPQPCAG
jgi:phage shock protein PspC (stress-responsive transcriptional regulator)